MNKWVINERQYHFFSPAVPRPPTDWDWRHLWTLWASPLERQVCIECCVCFQLPLMNQRLCGPQLGSKLETLKMGAIFDCLGRDKLLFARKPKTFGNAAGQWVVSHWARRFHPAMTGQPFCFSDWWWLLPQQHQRLTDNHKACCQSAGSNVNTVLGFTLFNLYFWFFFTLGDFHLIWADTLPCLPRPHRCLYFRLILHLFTCFSWWWVENQFSLFHLQAKPLQQEVREEVPDCGRALQGAAAHCLLPQDGDETGHRAGGEWGRIQTALCDAFYCFHAVSDTRNMTFKMVFMMPSFQCFNVWMFKCPFAKC